MPVAFIRQQVLRKLRAQHGQPRFYIAQPVRGDAFQLRALPDETAPRQHQHPRLFRVQTQIVASLP